MDERVFRTDDYPDHESDELIRERELAGPRQRMAMSRRRLFHQSRFAFLFQPTTLPV